MSQPDYTRKLTFTDCKLVTHARASEMSSLLKILPYLLAGTAEINARQAKRRAAEGPPVQSGSLLRFREIYLHTDVKLCDYRLHMVTPQPRLLLVVLYTLAHVEARLIAWLGTRQVKCVSSGGLAMRKKACWMLPAGGATSLDHRIDTHSKEPGF